LSPPFFLPPSDSQPPVLGILRRRSVGSVCPILVSFLLVLLQSFGPGIYHHIDTSLLPSPTTFHLSSRIIPTSTTQPHISHMTSLPAFLHAITPLLPGVVTRFPLSNDGTELSERFPHWHPYVSRRDTCISPTLAHVRFETPLEISLLSRPLRSSLRPTADLFVDTFGDSQTRLSNFLLLHPISVSSFTYLFFHALYYIIPYHYSRLSCYSRRNIISLV
jgi:hypothetical protein